MRKIAKRLSLAREIVRPLQHVVGGIGVAYTEFIGCGSFIKCAPTNSCDGCDAGSAAENRNCTAPH